MTRVPVKASAVQRLSGGRDIVHTRTRGIALVAVLWVLVLLSLIAANVTSTSRVDLSIAHNVTAAVEARLLADATVERAIFELLAPRFEDPWMSDGRPRHLELEGSDVLVSIQNEAGKLDLNYGSEDLLRKVFLELGLDTEAADTLVDRVVDYRDEDDVRRFKGAEADDYRRLGLPYVPTNSDFKAIDELRRVPGVTPRLFAQLRELVTIHSQGPDVDPVLAPERLLKVMPDLDPGTMATILDSRAATDDAERGNEPSAAVAPGPRQGTFTIVADAHTTSGGHYRRLAVVRLELGGDPAIDILDWRQDLDSWAGVGNIGSESDEEDRL